MSGGAMLYAVDLESIRAAFPGGGTIAADALWRHLESHAHALPNGAHSPSRLDDLFALDTILDAANYPAEFRYARLLYDPASLNVVMVDDSIFVGSIPANVVSAVATRFQTEGAPAVADPWQARTIEELLAAAQAAAKLGVALVGVYL